MGLQMPFVFRFVYTTTIGQFKSFFLQVDRSGISIVGVGIYGGIGHYEYELELLEDVSYAKIFKKKQDHIHVLKLKQTSLSSGLENQAAHRWNSLEITRGSFGPEDFAPDIVEIKFDRAVPIKVV